jgi:hypothetical protein
VELQLAVWHASDAQSDERPHCQQFPSKHSNPVPHGV